MNQEPNLDRNYWIALVLSMAVLMGYSLFLQKAYPSKKNLRVPKALPITQPASPAPAKDGVLNAAEGPFLEKQNPPPLAQYKNNLFDAELSTLGGTLTRLAYTGEEHKSGIKSTVFFDGGPQEPGLFGIRITNEDRDLSKTIFKLNRRGENFEFVYEKPGAYRLTKLFYFDTADPILGLEVTVKNLSDREKTFPLELSYGLDASAATPAEKTAFQAVVQTDRIKLASIQHVAKKGFSVSEDIRWAGLVKKYFALLVKPDWKAVNQESKAREHFISASIRMDPLTLKPGEKTRHQFFIYAGPQRYELLMKFNAGFEEVMARGFLGVVKILLLRALKFFNQYCHNFGWAIILLTFVIKGLFTPLTHMSFESMRKMQALQPKIKSLQEHYKNDPTKLNQKMMELYKKNKVNPLGGCLPMVLQIPIFIAFYQVLSEAIELKGAPFIGWIRDLAEPDRLVTFPVSLPFLGDSFHLLPLLMLGSMIAQQKLTPQQMGTTPEQTRMMSWMMPIMFGVLFYRMPSGLVLYWFVNNMLSVIHQVFVKRMAAVAIHHEAED